MNKIALPASFSSVLFYERTENSYLMSTNSLKWSLSRLTGLIFDWSNYIFLLIANGDYKDILSLLLIMMITRPFYSYKFAQAK